MNEKPEFSPDHLSTAQIGLLFGCPEAFRLRYIEKVKVAMSASMLQGRAYDVGITHNLSQKIESKEDLPVGDVLDMVDTAWTLDIKNTAFAKDEDRHGMKDKVIETTRVFQEAESPAVRPLSVQEPWEVSFDNVGYTLALVFDVLTRGRILENKFSGKRWAQHQADNSLQMTAQTLGFYQKRKRWPRRMEFKVGVAKASPEVQTLSTRRTKRDISWFLDTVGRARAMIKSGIFPPWAHQSWRCTSKYCRYWNVCRGKSRKSYF